MLQKIRNNQMISWATLETICSLLDCQPGDLLEYVKEAQETPDTAQSQRNGGLLCLEIQTCPLPLLWKKYWDGRRSQVGTKKMIHTGSRTKPATINKYHQLLRSIKAKKRSWGKNLTSFLNFLCYLGYFLTVWHLKPTLLSAFVISCSAKAAISAP